MKAFGLNKTQIDILKKAFKKFLPLADDTRVYIFGSRARGNHKKNSDIDIAVKSKDKSLVKKMSKLTDYFEDSDLPYKVDLSRWDQIIPEYKPQISKDKKLLWSSKDSTNKSKWRICPLGEHWVTRHKRVLKSGTVVDRDGHCRKSQAGKDIIKAEEIFEISKLPLFLNAKPKVSRKSLSFEHGNKYNSLITGWVAYWNNILEPTKPLHPNIVKALIASESSFISKSSAKNKLKVGDAQGLVQITEQTQKILKDIKGELKDHFVFLRKKDIWDPNNNICAAVRWLFRKQVIASAKLKRPATWEEAVFEYKGILFQKNKKANEIKRSFFKYLKGL